MKNSQNRLQASGLRLQAQGYGKLFSYSLIIVLAFSSILFAQEVTQAPQEEKPVVQEEVPSAKELVRQAWDAQGKKDYQKVFEITNKCINLYKEEADRIAAGLKAMPKESEADLYLVMTEVATCMFIQAEAYMRQEKYNEAIEKFQEAIDKYPFALAWDPRGWYWSVAKVSKESIDKIKKIIEGATEKKEEKKEEARKEVIQSKIVLKDVGTEDVVNYLKYGKFEGVGTENYKYIVEDQSGLSLAAGEGIYPNTTSIRWNPEFKEFCKNKRLDGSHWDFVHTKDLQAAFFKWATAPEPTGVRLYYTALILEKSGLIKHALKAYYAIVVHFPGTYGWTYWHTPWYIGSAAISKIKYLLRRHPELGYELKDAKISIINGYDNDVSNDKAVVSPGKFVKVQKTKKIIKDIKKFINKHDICNGAGIKRTIGSGKVNLAQCKNGNWQLIVDNRPYVIKGVTYSPTKVGQSPDEGTLGNWMYEDFNANGKIDGPYDSFVDVNKNNIQDKNEPSVGDFKLMKDMGINTIRLYHQPHEVNKEILRDLYKNYGIRVILGDFLGKYALGSGAPWDPGTDYNNPEHRKNMLESVTKMVMEFKDEPYILFWLLGNENVYGVACNANKDPESFFKFANEVALAIKAIDKEHPVAICSGDVLFLDRFGKFSPDVDLFGTNAYRGDIGFGNLWEAVKDEADKPVFITEFGCPAFAEGVTLDEAEALKKDYHQGCWEDVVYNMAGNEGAGNSVGAVIFEWLDEWWKAYEPSVHDTKKLFGGPFPDGFMREEWLGMSGQGDGSKSPFLRILRKAYYYYQKEWR